MAGAKDVVDRGLEAWRARDADAFAACYSDDAVIRAPGGLELRGKEGARSFMAVWREAFPDNEITIEHEPAVVVQELGPTKPAVAPLMFDRLNGTDVPSGALK